MSTKTYYHAGLSAIQEFYLPYGGLHMGGKGSALEAALRKLRKEENGHIYLHEVLVDDTYTIEQDDLGDATSWEKSWDNFVKRVNYPLAGWIYTNLFEPDVKKSLCLFRLDVIKSVKIADILSLTDAEDTLKSYEEQHSWPNYVY